LESKNLYEIQTFLHHLQEGNFLHNKSAIAEIESTLALAFFEEESQIGSLYYNVYPYDPIQIGSKLLRNAAEKNHSVAMYELGWRLLDGENYYPQDLLEGEKWLRQAIELGNTEAMWTLGSYMLDGEVKLRKEGEGEDLLKQAYQHGNINACYELIFRLLDGNGIEQNRKEGERLLQHLIGLGQIKAMRILGYRQYMGEGVEQDKQSGKHWLSEAAKKGDSIAKRNLKRIQDLEDDDNG
jgi:TPR repeat protein